MYLAVFLLCGPTPFMVGWSDSRGFAWATTSTAMVVSGASTSEEARTMSMHVPPFALLPPMHPHPPLVYTITRTGYAGHL